MRQAIATKFIGPTNHRCARIKAVSDACTVTVSWDYAMGVEENHHAAARALADKMGWVTHLRGGSLPGAGYVFVQG